MKPAAPRAMRLNSEAGTDARAAKLPASPQQAQTIDSGPELRTRQTRRRPPRRATAFRRQELRLARCRSCAARRSTPSACPAARSSSIPASCPSRKPRPGWPRSWATRWRTPRCRHGSERLLQQKATQTLHHRRPVFPRRHELRATARRHGGARRRRAIRHPPSLQPRPRERSRQDRLRYMARAGYDPREAIDFWERMEQGDAAAAQAAGIHVHPPQPRHPHRSNSRN